MRFIEFSPYWNVPPSIARAETVPQLRRDPGYFEREGFEFVGPDGQRRHHALGGQPGRGESPVSCASASGRGRATRSATSSSCSRTATNIYLHHTPATQLFERDRRDFSHGCIRVEHPVALAKFVLQGMPEWTEDRIRQAMGKGESTTLRLAEPVRVLIAYGTTLVKGGRIYFFDDIYGQDRLLDAALRRIALDRRHCA